MSATTCLDVPQEPIPTAAPVATPTPTTTPAPASGPKSLIILSGQTATAYVVHICDVQGRTVSGCNRAGQGEKASRITVNAGNSIAYFAHVENNFVSACKYTSSKAFTCVRSDSALFKRPDQLAVNGNFAYVANIGTSQVLACLLSEDRLKVSDCVDSGAPTKGPREIAIKDGIAYITSFDNNQVLACTVSGKALLGCESVGQTFNKPSGIRFEGFWAHVTNYGDSSITICSVAPASKRFIECVTSKNALFTDALTVDLLDTTAYLSAAGKLIVCTISNKQYTNCVDVSASTGGIAVSGVAIP